MKKKTHKIAMDDACNIIANYFVDRGQLPPDVKVTAIVPANGRSYIAFEWEQE